MTDWLMASDVDVRSTSTGLTALLAPGKCHCSNSSRPTLPSSAPPTQPAASRAMACVPTWVIGYQSNTFGVRLTRSSGVWARIGRRSVR
jgi:hypothetical protein